MFKKTLIKWNIQNHEILTYFFINISTLVFKVFPEANRAGLIGDSFNLARYGRERQRQRDRESKQLLFSMRKCLATRSVFHNNIFRAKLLHYDVALNMTTYLKHERGYAPWTAFMDSVEYIRSSISKSGAYVLMQVCL